MLTRFREERILLNKSKVPPTPLRCPRLSPRPPSLLSPFLDDRSAPLSNLSAPVFQSLPGLFCSLLSTATALF